MIKHRCFLDKRVVQGVARLNSSAAASYNHAYPISSDSDHLDRMTAMIAFQQY